MAVQRRGICWWSWRILVIGSAFIVAFRIYYGWRAVILGARTNPTAYAGESYWPPVRYYLASEQGTASVWIGQHRVMQFHGALGGLSARERADAAVRALDRELGPDRRPVEVRARLLPGGQWAVIVDDTQIAACGEQAARLNNTTPRGLARTWASNLEEALGAQ